jgi:predicted dehydrogenase
LRFKNGAIGVIEASTSVQPAQPRRIEIHGENGSAILNGDNVELKIVGNTDENNTAHEKDIIASGSSSPLAGFSIEPHKGQFETIVDAIMNNETPPVSGKDSLKSLAIVLAIYESAKSNKNIKLDEFVNNSLKP